MMKIVSKCALVAAVAALALAGTSSDSFAAKKKGKRAAACAPWTYKSANCTGALCTMNRCGIDGKWYASLVVCAQPFCPPK